VTTAISLPPYGSVVYVFDSGRSRQPWGTTDISPDRWRYDSAGIVAYLDKRGCYRVTQASREQKKCVDDPPLEVDLSRDWDFSYQAAGIAHHFDALQSWTTLGAARFVSGEAIYRKSFVLPEASVAGGLAATLDLGEVDDTAEVWVNGHRAATLWHRPFTAEIDRWLRVGTNEVEVRVTNRWINRVLGQADEPPESDGKPLAYPKPLEKETVKEPVFSGLLGPVSLSFSTRWRPRPPLRAGATAGLSERRSKAE